MSKDLERARARCLAAYRAARRVRHAPKIALVHLLGGVVMACNGRLGTEQTAII
jgi:hypothetical protein